MSIDSNDETDLFNYLDDLLDQMFEERLLRGRRDTRARKEFARWLAEHKYGRKTSMSYITPKEIKSKLASRSGLESVFDGSDYDRGQLEALEASNELLAKSFCKLLLLMLDKGFIGELEAIRVLHKYNVDEDDDELS